MGTYFSSSDDSIDHIIDSLDDRSIKICGCICTSITNKITLYKDRCEYYRGRFCFLVGVPINDITVDWKNLHESYIKDNNKSICLGSLSISMKEEFNNLSDKIIRYGNLDLLKYIIECKYSLPLSYDNFVSIISLAYRAGKLDIVKYVEDNYSIKGKNWTSDKRIVNNITLCVLKENHINATKSILNIVKNWELEDVMFGIFIISALESPSMDNYNELISVTKRSPDPRHMALLIISSDNAVMFQREREKNPNLHVPTLLPILRIGNNIGKILLDETDDFDSFTRTVTVTKSSCVVLCLNDTRMTFELFKHIINETKLCVYFKSEISIEFIDAIFNHRLFDEKLITPTIMAGLRSNTCEYIFGKYRDKIPNRILKINEHN